MWRWAKPNGIIHLNPLEDAEPASRRDYKKRDVFTLEELHHLFPADFGAMITIWGSVNHATLFLLLATTGIRAQEIRALIWSDVIWDEAILCIEQAVKLHGEIGSTKTDYSKAVFLTDRMLDWLKKWRNESPFNADHHLIFFGSDESTPLNRKNILLTMKDCLAAYPDITADKILTPHCFRTTYNTLMRQAIRQKLLRLQLGHKSEAMTDRYDRAEVIDKIRPYNIERAIINRILG